jgi:hypothetical protein
MRKILMSAVMVGTLMSAAAPAAAQYGNRGGYGYQGQGQNIEQQLGQLQNRVDRLYQRRLISTNEARRLSREIEQTDRLYDRFRRNGLTRGEYGQIQYRVERLRAEIREERREGRDDRRDDRYDDRYDRRY